MSTLAETNRHQLLPHDHLGSGDPPPPPPNHVQPIGHMHTSDMHNQSHMLGYHHAHQIVGQPGLSQSPQHFNEDFTAELFQDHTRNVKDDWENAAVTQIVTRLGGEMSLASRREYEIAKAAAHRAALLFKERIVQLTQHNSQLSHLVNNPGYRRDLGYSMVLDPMNVLNPGPSLPQVGLEGTKQETSAKRKVECGMRNSVISSSKKARNSYASRWTKEQDEALRVAVDKFEGRNWKAIAELVPGRDHVQCLQRWKKVLRPGLVKGHWSAEEDTLLLQLIQDDKMHSWSMVASKIKGRTAKQCRERWSLNLDPSINRSPWTPEEDQLLIKLYDKLGGKWSEMKTQFNGRTENAVKTRYKSIIRAKAREWTQEQDAKLIELRMKHGKNWAAIKKELPGRSRNAIKVRCKTLEYDNTASSIPSNNNS